MFEFNSFWQRFLSVDVREEMSPSQKNKIYITRGASLFLAVLGPMFVLLNIAQGHLHLAYVNVTSTTLGLACLFLVKRKSFRAASILLVIGGGVIFLFSGLIFRNGMEYALLLCILGSVFMFESFTGRLLLASINGAGFLLVQVLQFDSSGPNPFPIERFVINMLTFLLSYYWILEIIRTVNGNYQRDIEQKNTDLIRSRLQLDEEHAQLMARTSELQVANQAKEKLFSIVAHDLRGPVGQLKTSMELLSAQDLSSTEFQEMAGDLKVGIDHAYECLDTLLVWSASQLRAIKPIFTEVSLRSVSLDSVALLAESATLKNIVVQITIPAEAQAWADETQTASIFRNLLSNALKFTPNGGSVTLSAQREDGFWRVSISDSGVGMPPEKIRQVLEPSTLNSTTGTENERGFGLGLQICQEFIQSNQGSLFIESCEGQGSTFYFTLPSSESRLVP